MKGELIESAALERLIGQVRGVMGARVTCDSQNNIHEIHVVAIQQRNAKRVVRDVESLVYVRTGQRIDHRKISVAQIAEPELPQVAQQIQLLALDRIVDTHDMAIHITMALGEQRSQGRSQASYSHKQAESLAGEATVEALNQLLGSQQRLQLVDVRVQPFGDIEICLAQLNDTEGPATLLGMAPVQQDSALAASHAVLDALCRAPHYAGQHPWVRFAFV